MSQINADEESYPRLNAVCFFYAPLSSALICVICGFFNLITFSSSSYESADVADEADRGGRAESPA